MTNSVVNSKWIEFEDITPQGSDRKTKLYEILPKDGGSPIGLVKWYGPWRQYCFFAFPSCIWNSECLDELSKFIKHLMEERKK